MKKQLKRALAVALALGLLCAGAHAQDYDFSDLDMTQLIELDELLHEQMLTTAQDQLDQYQQIGIEVLSVDPDTLREERETYAGHYVYTALYVRDVKKKQLKGSSDPEEGGNSVVLRFDDPEEIAGLKKGDVVSVVGEVEKPSVTHLGKAHVKSCHILSKGSDALDTLHSLQAAQARRQELEDEAAQSAYMAQCKTIPHESITRDPDAYRGEQIVVTGRVVYSEATFFRYETILIDSGINKLWKVSYWREEGAERMLVNDRISIYGTCNGLSNVKEASELGSSSNSIPSLSAVYIIYQ